MNPHSAKVLSYLTGTEDTDTVTVDDLQRLVAEHPYFPVTQFLLAQKLKGGNEGAYTSQVQKTALYFSNPYWLQYQLENESLNIAKYDTQASDIIFEENLRDDLSNTNSSIAEEFHPITTLFTIEELTAAGNLAHETLQDMPEGPTVEASKEISDTNTTNGDDETVTSQEVRETHTAQADEETAAITRNTDEPSEAFLREIDPAPANTDTFNAPLFPDLSPTASTEVIEIEEEIAGITDRPDKTTEVFLEEVTVSASKEEPYQDDEHDRMFQNIKAMLDASGEEADADTENVIIPIDPYYTIDYFASQGIKLELEQNPQDQLGQNLKKFTHWLRHMKKLGPEDAAEAINRTETDADIQQIADTSNTVREVVTEAMASVLEKQGKKDKAIELYNKLSFLNPHKSAYFADKIKKLKGI